jgi:polysaccharide pyruvyl transferase WcaK-like protein
MNGSEVRRIAICGETYSENLGDGVIADSLKWLLNSADRSVDVFFVDFSGRTGIEIENDGNAVKPSPIYIIHHRLARFSAYRKFVVLPLWYFSKRNRLSSLWAEALRESDLILIGGGQLLMDNDLGFPLKVRELVRIAKRLNKEIIFYACGVSAKWSWLGFRLLSDALLKDNVLRVSVRDRGSLDSLNELFPNVNMKLCQSVDPAICAAEVYGIQADLKSSKIGLGISAPNVLVSHSGQSKREFSVNLVKKFWIDLAELLQSRHREVVFFTNGQSEDYAFAQSIVAAMSELKVTKLPVLLEKSREPRTLIVQLAQFQAIVAHRLHANIIAYSLGIPSVGLIWDKKVEEFGKVTDRRHFYLAPSDMDPHVVDKRIDEAISTGLDRRRRDELKALAHEDARSTMRSFVKTNEVPNAE